jgi:ribonuclease P protein component
MDFSFPHTERLKSRKTIENLFKSGKGFMAYPFKVVWCTTEPTQELPLQIAISVPKRSFKRAVVRNTLKRRTREAWRLNKAALQLDATAARYAAMFIYVAKEELPYQEIERGMKKALRALPEEWAKGHTFTQTP